MRKLRVEATPKLVAIVEALGGPSAAARAWGVEYRSVRRFIAGGRTELKSATIAAILDSTRLGYPELFRHVPEEGKV
jgi:hypothetical protein